MSEHSVTAYATGLGSIVIADTSLAEASPIRTSLESILAEKDRELQQIRSRLRWNIEDDGKLVRVCEGLHDKGEPCEFVTYVPEALLAEKEQQIATEKARAEKNFKREVDRLHFCHIHWRGRSDYWQNRALAAEALLAEEKRLEKLQGDAKKE